MRSRALSVVAILGAMACAREETIEFEAAEPHSVEPPAPTDGWSVTYRMGANSRVAFALGNNPAGSFSEVTGTLAVNLLDLAETRGSFEVDLRSIERPSSEENEIASRVPEMLRWLDLGSKRPAEHRNRFGTALFSIRSIDRLSAKAAHDAKLVDEKSPSDEAELHESDETPADPEVRTASLRARGDLSLHGVRVDQTLRLVATFHYEAPALSGATPERIVIQTKRPFVVSLDTHGIKPRDEHGTVVSAELPLLGTKIPREARVDVDLIAKRAQ